MSCDVTSSKNKIGGYDKWDVESDARTLIKAEELKQGDSKYLKVIMGEVKKTAKAAVEAAEKKDAAAKKLDREKHVDAKLKTAFKDTK